MRAVAARACRNPYETIGFSRISSYDFNKTYENIRLSHPKIMKICQRAQAESFKNHWFFNIPVQRGFAGNFRAHLELLRSRSQGHHPCQIIPCGPHARVVASSSASSSSSSSRAVAPVVAPVGNLETKWLHGCTIALHTWCIDDAHQSEGTETKHRQKPHRFADRREHT